MSEGAIGERFLSPRIEAIAALEEEEELEVEAVLDELQQLMERLRTVEPEHSSPRPSAGWVGTNC